MTRFRQEITGQLGAFWQQSAEKEVQAAVESATKDATVDGNGAISWKSNGSFPRWKTIRNVYESSQQPTGWSRQKWTNSNA